jgi:23S rRNA G2445 N2-methylase RlmL
VVMKSEKMMTPPASQPATIAAIATTTLTTGTDGAKEFFAVIPPGFENLASLELKRWAPDIAQTVEPGGITFSTSLERAARLQASLKIPARFLMRVAVVAARDFPKLYKKATKVNWSDFVGLGQKISLNPNDIVVHDSRLNIKKRIAQAILDGFQDSFLKQNPAGNSGAEAKLKPIELLVRFDHNVGVISIDLSGELLGKRGQRQWVGAAPIRENLAAACLLALAEAPSSGGQDRLLIDPMAGSGVFLIEAQDLGAMVWRETGYAFEHLSALGVGSWRGDSALIKDWMSPWSKYIAVESDESSVRALKHNFNQSQNQFGLRPSKYSALHLNAKIEQIDASWAEQLIPLEQGPHSENKVDGKVGDIKNQKLVVNSATDIIFNPPYGERIAFREGPFDQSPQIWYTWLLEKFTKNFSPERIAGIFPAAIIEHKLLNSDTYKIFAIHKFSNGGLPVKLVVWSQSKARV